MNAFELVPYCFYWHVAKHNNALITWIFTTGDENENDLIFIKLSLYPCFATTLKHWIWYLELLSTNINPGRAKHKAHKSPF